MLFELSILGGYLNSSAMPSALFVPHFVFFGQWRPSAENKSGLCQGSPIKSSS